LLYVAGPLVQRDDAVGIGRNEQALEQHVHTGKSSQSDAVVDIVHRGDRVAATAGGFVVTNERQRPVHRLVEDVADRLLAAGDSDARLIPVEVRHPSDKRALSASARPANVYDRHSLLPSMLSRQGSKRAR
jgi:uncharacterized protein (UPF0248 family)